MKDHSTWQVLALLRFLLACIVVSTHFVWFAGPSHPLVALTPFVAIAAVLGFLFVSGYSIAHSLKRRPDGFYVRRLVRIYPLYAISIAVSLLPFLINHRQTIIFAYNTTRPPTLSSVLANLVFGETFFSNPIVTNPVIWTLSVEVACYLAAPLLHRAGRRAVFAMMLLSILCFVIYPHTSLPYYSLLEFGLPLILFAWAWLAGFIYYEHRSSVVATAIFIGGSTVVVALNMSPPQEGLLTVAVSASAIALAPFIRLPGWMKRPLGFLGDLSYPLYLLHLPCVALAWVLGVREPYLLIALVFAGSVAGLMIDAALHRLLDRLQRHPEYVPTPA